MDLLRTDIIKNKIVKKHKQSRVVNKPKFDDSKWVIHTPGKNTRYVGLDTLLKSDTNVRAYDIDPEVRGVVAELNKIGLKTTGSCSGHGERDGYIIFKSVFEGPYGMDLHMLTIPEQNMITSILGKYGLHVTGFELPHYENVDGEKLWSSNTSVDFVSPVAK